MVFQCDTRRHVQRGRSKKGRKNVYMRTIRLRFWYWKIIPSCNQRLKAMRIWTILLLHFHKNGNDGKLFSLGTQLFSLSVAKIQRIGTGTDTCGICVRYIHSKETVGKYVEAPAKFLLTGWQSGSKASLTTKKLGSIALTLSTSFYDP